MEPRQFDETRQKWIVMQEILAQTGSGPAALAAGRRVLCGRDGHHTRSSRGVGTCGSSHRADS